MDKQPTGMREPIKGYYPDLGWCWVCDCGDCLGRDRRGPAVYQCLHGHRWRHRYARWTRLTDVKLAPTEG